jgi:hypothetical protein
VSRAEAAGVLNLFFELFVCISEGILEEGMRALGLSKGYCES